MMPTTEPRRTWLLCACTLAFACPSDDTVQGDATTAVTAPTSADDSSATHGLTSTSVGDTSVGDTSVADTSGGVAAGPCSCVDASAFEGADDLEGPGCNPDAIVSWVSGCPEAQPCSRLTAQCPRPGADLYDCTNEVVFDEAALQCVLETLRDGTPARLELDGLEDMGVFSGQSQYVVHVLEGRRVVRAGCQSVDTGVLTFGPRTHVLQEPEFFTDCMAMAGPRDRYDCITLGIGEGEPLNECP